jgi:hypothetical protein
MKTLWIKLNEETHKPDFMAIEEPAENGDSILTILHGDKNKILTPIPDEEEQENEEPTRNKQ